LIRGILGIRGSQFIIRSLLTPLTKPQGGSIHGSAWKENSTNFASTEFSEARPAFIQVAESNGLVSLNRMNFKELVEHYRALTPFLR
jgi:hypothetical protein